MRGQQHSAETVQCHDPQPAVEGLNVSVNLCESLILATGRFSLVDGRPQACLGIAAGWLSRRGLGLYCMLLGQSPPLLAYYPLPLFLVKAFLSSQ